MALEIKPTPVLTGKNAEYFYKALASAKEGKSAEEVKAINAKVWKHMEESELRRKL